MTAGTCLPGSYVLMYTEPSSGQHAYLNVKVEHLTRVYFSYSFVNAAVNR